MPSEHLTTQSHSRPNLNPDRRSNSSITSGVDSPSTSPNHHGARPKAQKHIVHGARTHTRVPSTKGLHKLTKTHGIEGSHQDLKKLVKNSSTTSLKKNSSHVSLKKNRSFVDVRPKSSHGLTKRPASVHFEIGDQDEGWEEASGSTSPALSRSASKSAVSAAQLSSKSNTDKSRPQSSSDLPPSKHQESSVNGLHERTSARHSATALTEKLLQRTHSHNTTKMSLATATPTGRSPPSPEKSQSSTANGTPKTGSNSEVISRFVGGSVTPNDSSFILRKSESSAKPLNPNNNDDIVKRAHSMGNLTRYRSASDSDEEESALAPRSRKSSAHSSYIPPQQSRTQQKLWLQRASSNIEPAQMAPGVGISGVLVGAVGYDGRDHRIKGHLERTGLEYLVVRRHQDPVGKALKRLPLFSGSNKNRRIPPSQEGGARGNGNTNGKLDFGLSQSLRSQRKENLGNGHGHAHTPSTGSIGKGSYDGVGTSTDRQHEKPGAGREVGDEGIGAILRSMWEKGFDLSASAD